MQEEVAEEIIEELKKDTSVIGIEIFGSLARTEVRIDSDIDLAVTLKNLEEDQLVQKSYMGIEVDIWLQRVEVIREMVEDYPYLFVIPDSARIIYDPENILTKAYEHMIEYYNNHPEVVKFWKETQESYQKEKQKGIKPKHFFDILDEAEIRFSKEKKVTRNFYKK